MLDINLLRKDLDAVLAGLNARKSPQAFLDLVAFTTLEAERKTIQTRTEELQARRNTLSKQIGQLKAKGTAAEVDAVMAQTADIKTELEHSATQLERIQSDMQAMLLAVPNLPHASVPRGADEHGNVVARSWGTPRAFDFAIKDHVDVGAPLRERLGGWLSARLRIASAAKTHSIPPTPPVRNVARRSAAPPLISSSARAQRDTPSRLQVLRRRRV